MVVATACLRGSLPIAVNIILEACDRFQLTPWTLRGDPRYLRFSQNAIATRIVLMLGKVSGPSDLVAERAIGTAHVIRVAPAVTRISFHGTMLDGTPIPAPNEAQLVSFAQRVLRQVEEAGLRIPAPTNEASTGPLRPGPILRPDTGPLQG